MECGYYQRNAADGILLVCNNGACNHTVPFDPEVEGTACEEKLIASLNSSMPIIGIHVSSVACGNPFMKEDEYWLRCIKCGNRIPYSRSNEESRCTVLIPPKGAITMEQFFALQKLERTKNVRDNDFLFENENLRDPPGMHEF